ncbi:hypothetical protein GOP47_0010815 [Adiantum capillus-veneris]|uniref:glutamate carboxypeptidase II n=1 Tax=Adiantum capillus-veneris TaxID=13818 RepID=A0A9D4ZII6_ADICA|nr:hypothetical protein GOP47_0010177 [Adiantum capillus-veneris]KAI5074854.1 hypothetical protein GOP47_0010815 [Adiantum capillus-veneris]
MDANHWGKHAPTLSEPDSLEALTSQNEATNSQRVFLSQQRPVMHLDIDGESTALPLKCCGLQRSFFKACCGSTLILVVAILVGFSISIVSFKLTGWSSWHEQDEQRFRHHHHHFVDLALGHSVERYLKELTKAPHVAGSLEDMATADYVKGLFESYGLRTGLKDYEVLLSYPVERSITLLFPNGSEVSLLLTEEPPNAKAIPPFHAYAPSGNVTEEVVYANYGRQEDYSKLDTMNVSVSGKIVIVRYGAVFRGDVVSIAANAGASAVILYSDPEDFAGGGKGGFFPDAEWLPPTGVQRGTVYQGSGDPTTPGWPSSPNGERLSDVDVAAVLPQIPSLPISANDALFIMSSLEGEVAPPDWHGALEIPQYRVGTGPVKVNLDYKGMKKLTRIRNVYGIIEGSEEPDRYVLLGNHRDAWTFGAVDPNSGTAALLEIARRFGILTQHGWQPRRTLVLCSWDAEEYGLIGSTEWVEENIDLLAVKAVAYLNVDCAVVGPGFYAAATPQLDMLLKEVAKEIDDPDSQEKSVLDTWTASAKGKPMVTRLGGGGSDFTAFLQHVGVPSVDMYFGQDYPVYHSLYDNLQWLEKFGDPSFKRLIAASTIWGLVGLRIADSLIIPFDYRNYADELEVYTKAVEKILPENGLDESVSVEPIWSAIQNFRAAVVQVEKEVEVLHKAKAGSANFYELRLSVRILNDRLLQTERAFLDRKGLSGAEWHKHLVYGPSKSDKYGVSFFPGINGAISAALTSGNWGLVQHEVWKVARAIERATVVIVGQLV